MTDVSNYGALSEGLRFYVAAMRRFIARTLQEQHGDSDDWFDEQAMSKLPKPMRNSIQQRRAVQQRQRASDGGDGPELLLDPVHFRYVINAHWDNTYEAIFGERVALHWIGEIAYWRNVWAHAADKAEAEAERILDTCVRVVDRFDPETAQRIERIRAGITAAPATDGEAATDDGLAEVQNEETASDGDREVPKIDISALRVTPSDLGFDEPKSPFRLVDHPEKGEPVKPEPPQDEALLELVREYWQYQNLQYLGNEGLADEDAATEIWVEATSRLTLALVQEVITPGAFDGVNHTTSPPTYDFSNAGIAVSIQIWLPKWAL